MTSQTIDNNIAFTPAVTVFTPAPGLSTPDFFLLKLAKQSAPELCRLFENSCSPIRLERADRYIKVEDRLRCLAAGWLASHAAEQITGARGINEEHNPQGKPFFPQFPDVALSISHSGPWIACALHTGGPIGVDVEMQPETTPGMTEIFMSPEELQAYQSCPSTDEQRCFFHRIWCLKESWLKAVGTGMLQDPKGVTIRPLSSGMTVCGKNDEHWYTFEKRLDDGSLLTACWQ